MDLSYNENGTAFYRSFLIVYYDNGLTMSNDKLQQPQNTYWIFEILKRLGGLMRNANKTLMSLCIISEIFLKVFISTYYAIFYL